MQGPSTGFSTLLPFNFPALCFRLELSYPTGQFQGTHFSPVCFGPLDSEVSWVFLACELLETCVALLCPFGILPFHFVSGFHHWSVSLNNLIFSLLTALLYPIPFLLAVITNGCSLCLPPSPASPATLHWIFGGDPSWQRNPTGDCISQACRKEKVPVWCNKTNTQGEKWPARGGAGASSVLQKPPLHRYSNTPSDPLKSFKIFHKFGLFYVFGLFLFGWFFL